MRMLLDNIFLERKLRKRDMNEIVLMNNLIRKKEYMEEKAVVKAGVIFSQRSFRENSNAESVESQRRKKEWSKIQVNN